MLELMLKLQETHAYITNEGGYAIIVGNIVRDGAAMQKIESLYITHVHCRWNCKLKQENKLMQGDLEE